MIRRVIFDNILIVNKVLYFIKVRKSKVFWIMIKLDIEKVYNREEWDLLFKSFQVLGFYFKWIK